MTLTFYKYDLEASQDLKLFNPETPLLTAEEAIGKIDDFLHGATISLTSVKKGDKKGTATIHPNRIVRSALGITVIEVCNEKSLRYWQEYQEREVTSAPFATVIIDNRPGVAQMAIEHSTAFSDPDRVCEIIRTFLNYQLAPYGWVINIRPKRRFADIWEIVEQQKREGDRMKEIKIMLPANASRETIDATEEVKNRLEWLMYMQKCMNAAKATMLFNAGRRKSIDLEAAGDIANIIATMCNNGYDIAIRFSKLGVYRAGKTIRAIYDIADGIVANFVNKQKTIANDGESETYDLAIRLDQIRELTQTFDHEQESQEVKESCKAQQAKLI